MTTRTRYTLSDLPGIGDVEAAFAVSADDAVALLEGGEFAVTGAGDRGAINIWRVGDSFHCERYAFRATKALAVAEDLDSLAAWARENWPLILAEGSAE